MLFDWKPGNAAFKEPTSTTRFRSSEKTRGRSENIAAFPSNRKRKRRAPTEVGSKRTGRLQTPIPHVFFSSGRRRGGKSVSDDARGGLLSGSKSSLVTSSVTA